MAHPAKAWTDADPVCRGYVSGAVIRYVARAGLDAAEHYENRRTGRRIIHEVRSGACPS